MTTPTPPDMPELLPCPFCGSTKLQFRDAGFNHMRLDCDGCGVSSRRVHKSYDFEAAISKAWNARSTPAPVQDEARREICSVCCGHGRVRDEDNLTSAITTCPECRGSGYERAALSAPSREKELMAVIADLADKQKKLWKRIAYQRKLGFAHQDDKKLLEETEMKDEKHAAIIAEANGIK